MTKFYNGTDWATHTVDLLLANTYSLYDTARELSQRDPSGSDLAEWVGGWFWLDNPCMAFGANSSDRRAIENTRDAISPNEYDQIDWKYITASLSAD